jgi:hypothetical protein
MALRSVVPGQHAFEHSPDTGLRILGLDTGW